MYLKPTFLYPLLLNAISYSIFDAWKISAFEEFLDNLSLIAFGSFFIICGGWLEFLLISSSVSLGFYKAYMNHLSN